MVDGAGDLELVEREPVAAEPPKPAAALSTAAAAAKQDPLAKLSFSYRPVWDKTRNVVSAFSCLAQVRLSDVGPASDDATAMIGDDPLTVVQKNPHAFGPAQMIYLEGAAHDEYSANIGARKIYEVLKTRPACCTFYEPPGHHSDHVRERLQRGLQWVFNKPLIEIK